MSQDDFERPLNERGRAATALIADYIRAQGIAPNLILSSSARRARETVERIFGSAVTVAFEDALYLASADRLLARLHAVEDASSVMMVGHNPGLANLAVALMGRGDKAVGEMMMTKYPTGGLACFSLKIDRWSDLAAEGTHLDAFIRPRDLTD